MLAIHSDFAFFARSSDTRIRWGPSPVMSASQWPPGPASVVRCSAAGAALAQTGASLPLPQAGVVAMTAPAAKAKRRCLMFMLEELLIASHGGKRFLSVFIVLALLVWMHFFQRSRVSLTGKAAAGLIDILWGNIDGSDDAADAARYLV